VVCQLVTGLDRRGDFRLLLVVLNPGELASRCGRSGVRTVVLDESRQGFLSLLADVRRVAAGFRPDIVHAHRYKENLLAALVRPLCGRPRLVTTVHGLPEFQSGPRARLRNRLDAAVLRACRFRVVGVSRDVSMRLARDAHLAGERITTITNGLELPPAVPSREPGDTVRIGSAGRMTPVKNYHAMVDIAGDVHRANRRTSFQLAGDGPEKASLAAALRARGLDGVFGLPGAFENIYDFLERIDIFVNTSHHEGVPMSVLEAMACEIPVVAFAVGGLREIVTDGTDGFLVPPGDRRRFADRLLELAGDPALLRRMGRAARRKVENSFSREAMVNAYTHLYRTDGCPCAPRQP